MMDLSLSRCLVLAVCVCAVVSGADDDSDDGHTAGAPGAPVRLPDSDPGLLKALRFAEERYNMQSNGMHVRRVSRIISATRQVRHCIFYIFYLWTHVHGLYLFTQISHTDGIRPQSVFLHVKDSSSPSLWLSYVNVKVMICASQPSVKPHSHNMFMCLHPALILGNILCADAVAQRLCCKIVASACYSVRRLCKLLLLTERLSWYCTRLVK